MIHTRRVCYESYVMLSYHIALYICLAMACLSNAYQLHQTIIVPGPEDPKTAKREIENVTYFKACYVVSLSVVYNVLAGKPTL